MHLIKHKFKKIKRTDSEKSSKVLIVNPKMPPSPHFGMTFFQKRKLYYLIAFNES